MNHTTHYVYNQTKGMYSKRAAQYHDLGDSVQIQETIKKLDVISLCLHIFSLVIRLMVVVFTVPKK